MRISRALDCRRCVLWVAVYVRRLRQVCSEVGSSEMCFMGSSKLCSSGLFIGSVHLMCSYVQVGPSVRLCVGKELCPLLKLVVLLLKSNFCFQKVFGCRKITRKQNTMVDYRGKKRLNV